MSPREVVSAPCRIGQVLTVLDGRWKGAVLWWLKQDGTLRFGELRRAIPEVTPKVLTLQLRQLERDGLVKRVVHAEVPPRVEYSLTPLAGDLLPLLDRISAWGAANIGRVERARGRYDAR